MRKKNIYFIKTFRPAAHGGGETKLKGSVDKSPPGPLFFYTSTCPGGVYLTGVLTDKEIESRKRKGTL